MGIITMGFFIVFPLFMIPYGTRLVIRFLVFDLVGVRRLVLGGYGSLLEFWAINKPTRHYTRMDLFQRTQSNIPKLSSRGVLYSRGILQPGLGAQRQIPPRISPPMTIG